MAETIFFTDNYQDRGTREGYQFEFFCRRWAPAIAGGHGLMLASV